MQGSVERRVDTVSVSIGDLTVIAAPSGGPPNDDRRHSWRRPIAVAAVVAMLVVGGVVGRSVISDDDASVVPAAELPGLAAPLTISVTAAATSVVYGEPLELRFTWHDGDGTLIDVNRVEATAVSYRKDVRCDDSVVRPTAISDSGTWRYVPDAMNFGPPPVEPRVVQVGLEVRTGGCAPTERAVGQLAVTVLPLP